MWVIWVTIIISEKKRRLKLEIWFSLRILALWDYVKAERDREKCEPSEQQRPSSEKEDHRADQRNSSPMIIQQTWVGSSLKSVLRIRTVIYRVIILLWHERLAVFLPGNTFRQQSQHAERKNESKNQNQLHCWVDNLNNVLSLICVVRFFDSVIIPPCTQFLFR